MYARDLMLWLHERLGDFHDLEASQKRFESLRGFGLLPRGRENAAVRLSDEQIANAVLSFGHHQPGYGGHAALILGGLCPVGGEVVSFQNTETLRDAVAALISNEGASSDLARFTLTVEKDFHGEDYRASIWTMERPISYVSNLAVSLLSAGADKDYDHEKLRKLSARERSLGPSFFRALAAHVALTRHLDRPLKTDWREYEAEEDRAAFHKRLGARNSSHFLNLRVDAQVAWPKVPTRIQFGGHNLVLFPKTADYSHSVSIDLTNERISSEAARTLINRMLSIMAWCEDQPASLHEGWSGNPVPVPVSRKDLAFVTMNEWHFYRTIPTDEKLLQCLAYYRDGLNAESVGLGSHAVLSFFRVFETRYDKRKKVVDWVNRVFPDIKETVRENAFDDLEADRVTAAVDVGTYIYANCRVAVAHAASDQPSDPDGAEEMRRLLTASDIIRELARHFIKTEFALSTSYLSDTA
ncbi:methylamine utilization protein MauJ [Rhizobium johnstonii]|uniref:methylamine utilization protein MauJ n=1 Tax=Rhizobium johnstonii TaxID=3019933 RepID=UPI003F985CD6|nr:hypothetical protein U8Q07_15115 [Rhizobium ruizarguesonis]